MTCIVGYMDREKNKIYMGGDSAGISNANYLVIRADEKVFKNGDYLIGFTTSFRMGQLLRYAFNPPIPEEGENLNKFMVTKFIDSIRKCLKDGGYAQRDKEEELGGTFLVGYKGHLFEIHADYQVGIPADGYTAVGCGEQIAKGVLFSMNRYQESVSPEEKIRCALEAAERFSAGVRGPFTILS